MTKRCPMHTDFEQSYGSIKYTDEKTNCLSPSLNELSSSSEPADLSKNHTNGAGISLFA